MITIPLVTASAATDKAADAFATVTAATETMEPRIRTLCELPRFFTGSSAETTPHPAIDFRAHSVHHRTEPSPRG